MSFKLCVIGGLPLSICSQMQSFDYCRTNNGQTVNIKAPSVSLNKIEMFPVSAIIL